MPSRCWPISCATLRADGHAISHVDLGGGLGIPYRDDNEPPPHPDAYADVVKRATRDLGCTLIFEPGRLIVGNAGILVTRVLYVKRGEAKTFVIVDAAMNDLIRPTLYEAHHDIRPVREPAPRRRGSSPTWSGRSASPAISWRSTASMPEPQPGDLLAMMTAGAYGAVQAGTYNTRAAGAGSAGAGRRMGAGAAPPRGRRIDRARSPAALAVMLGVNHDPMPLF